MRYRKDVEAFMIGKKEPSWFNWKAIDSEGILYEIRQFIFVYGKFGDWIVKDGKDIFSIKNSAFRKDYKLIK